MDSGVRAPAFPTFPLLTIPSCGLISTNTKTTKAAVEKSISLSVHVYIEQQIQRQSSNKVQNPYLSSHKKVTITRKHKATRNTTFFIST